MLDTHPKLIEVHVYTYLQIENRVEYSVNEAEPPLKIGMIVIHDRDDKTVLVTAK